MINTRWLELPLSRKYVHGSIGVRAIEVLLYFFEEEFLILGRRQHSCTLESVKLIKKVSRKISQELEQFHPRCLSRHHLRKDNKNSEKTIKIGHH